MTDPKTLTDEQTDAIWDRFEDAPTMSYRYLVTEAIALATRQQTASTEPIGWVVANVAERFRAEPDAAVYLCPTRPDARFMPLYAAPVEQAGSPPLVYPAQPDGKEKQ